MLYMIGGIDMFFGGSVADTIITLDLQTLDEKYYGCHYHDIPRSDASACCYERENNLKILVFGGDGEYPNTVQNSVLECDIAQQQHTLLTEPTDTNETPRGRCHSFTKVINNTMVMYGGMTKEEMFYDMWSFDLETYKWEKIHQHGDVPNSYEFCCTISKDRLLCVSDHAVYLCDLRVATWKRLRGEVALNFVESYRDRIVLYYEETGLSMTLRFFCNQHTKEFTVFKTSQPKFVRSFIDIEILCKS